MPKSVALEEKELIGWYVSCKGEGDAKGEAGDEGRGDGGSQTSRKQAIS